MLQSKKTFANVVNVVYASDGYSISYYRMQTRQDL